MVNNGQVRIFRATGARATVLNVTRGFAAPGVVYTSVTLKTEAGDLILLPLKEVLYQSVAVV